MKKKMMSLVAVGLAVSMLAGCGNAGTPGNESSGGVESSAQESKASQEEESSEASGDTGEGTEGSGNVNEFGWEVPEETLVINILDATGDYAPTEGEKAGEENVIKYFCENITRDTLGEIVYLSPGYLAASFKKETGSSLGSYIIERRMEKAKALLAEGKLTVSEVAFAVGYDNFTYFSRLFKNKVGVMPKEYKKGKKR